MQATNFHAGRQLRMAKCTCPSRLRDRIPQTFTTNRNMVLAQGSERQKTRCTNKGQLAVFRVLYCKFQQSYIFHKIIIKQKVWKTQALPQEGLMIKFCEPTKGVQENILNTMWSLHYSTCKGYCCHLRTKATKCTMCYGPVQLFRNQTRIHQPRRCTKPLPSAGLTMRSYQV